MNLQRRRRGNTSIFQLSSNQAVVSAPSLSAPQVVGITSHITGVDVWESRILLWSVEDASVFESKPPGIQHVASFDISENCSLAINHSSIFQTNGASVSVLSFEGLLKQTLPLDEKQGQALCLDVCRDFLVLVTTNCFLRIWKVDCTELKPHGPISGRRVTFSGDEKLVVTSVRCNSDCSRISLLVKCGRDTGENSHIVVFDTIIDRFFSYNFRHLQKVPTSHCWDSGEPRLIVCETAQEQIETVSPLEKKSTELHLTTLFSTSEDGLLELEQVTTGFKSRLLGMDIPYYYILATKPAKNETSSTVIEKITMRDFVGLEEVAMKERAALIEFNYNLILGNLSGAFEAVQAIQDKKIWHSLACICVKTKRVEVALHCFATMGWSSAAGFVCSSLHEPEEDARVAAVAIQLGLLDAARQLYIGCKRFDLLKRLYETCGEWDKAIEVASKHDRVHLKGTLHAYAKHLESLGSIKDAIHHYEVSGSHRHEVPRMLYSVQQMKELQDYIDKSVDPPLQRWWAHFCEANNLLPQAIDYYTVAGDVTSLVRVYCFKGDFSTAAALVLESSDAAAAFSLARQYEKSGNIRQAIKFFSKAAKFTYAARLAMKHNIDNELLALSLQSTKEMMTQAAKYYEDKRKYEEAVLLYHKGGDLEKAINVCFRTQLYDALKAIAEDLDKDEDPALLAKCGEFLLLNKQIDKAVQLFIAAKQFRVALDLCLSEGVILTDKMAEAMKLEDQKSEESISLLQKIADVFSAQGSYHLACKKYTQAGDRLTAMKALLKSGDTERIIFFANVSRHKQIYILAANYLQNLDWHHDGNIMRTIIQLYSKAAEMDALASFYESCAQIEIDEYRDYEKALAAMTEALKYFTNSKSPDKDEKVQSVRSRISEVEQFVQIRRMARSEPAGLVQACSEFLIQLTKSSTNTQASVRIGDVYALLIEFYYSHGSMEQAFHVIEKMRARKIALGPFVDQSLVLSIYQELGFEATEDDLNDTVGEEIESL